MKKNTIEENKKGTIENIKNAKRFIAITDSNMSVCANGIEIMALVTTMLQALVEREIIDKKDLDIIFEVAKNNIENNNKGLDGIIDKITESIIKSIFEGEK